MSKRISIVLPDRTLAILDRIVSKRSRGQFVSRAILHFVKSDGKESLAERLKLEALANAARDVEMTAEWGCDYQ